MACGLEPILCAPLLARVDAALVELLTTLSPAEWHAPTIVPNWQVRHIAAHLADTALRKLTLVRDAWLAEPLSIQSPADLSALVHRLNREGVTVYSRLSPPLLLSLLTSAARQSAAFHEALNPFAPAAFAVSWAGESQSLNWFDTARELTERWHHQQQIRLALNRPGNCEHEIVHAVLDTFLRGLPHAMAAIAAPPHTTLAIEITGPGAGHWFLTRAAARWNFTPPPTHPPQATLILPSIAAWRIFTKGMDPSTARASAIISGDEALALAALRLTAIVA